MASVEEIALLSRMAERLLGVLIGGVCVYLGYRLFTKLPDRADSEGRLVLPGGINIWLSRIGPGVFFALFGAGIVAIAFSNAVLNRSQSIVTVGPDGVVQAVTHQKEMRGMASASRSPNAPESALHNAESQTYTLNHDVRDALRHDLDDETRKRIEVALDYSKRQILRAVWEPQWGPFTAFEHWADTGAQLPVPRSLRTPGAIYLGDVEQPAVVQ